jgi:hypothetical protein
VPEEKLSWGKLTQRKVNLGKKYGANFDGETFT